VKFSDVKGIIAAMVTPFDKDQRINKESTRELLNYLINAGIDGIFIIGGAGEFATLSLEEKKELMEIVVEENNGRIPVYAGTGAVTTSETIRLTNLAQDIGVDASSIISPYSINPSQNELFDHFKDIALNTTLPIVIYNHPARTGVNISAEVISKLSEFENIVGVKDSSGDLTLTMDYINVTDDCFSVLEGIDTLIYASLTCGAQGSISSTAAVLPGLAVKIYESYVKGDYDLSIKYQNRLAILRTAFSLGTFPAVLKESLNIMGLSVGLPRKPVNPLTEKNRDKLRVILKNMGEI
jgi:4-hydroxy-tetrahydrodipicolinate synthase